MWLSRSGWSLALLAELRAAETGHSPSVWIPDYFCNGPLAALRQTGARIVFYPLLGSLDPDMEACRELSKSSPPPDIFLVVHFFGTAANSAGAAAFCEGTGAWLVEDAAHALKPIPGVGESGDFVLYSPHKHMPIPDGAVLVGRPGGPARINAEDAVMRLTVLRDSAAKFTDRSILPELAWTWKRLLQKGGVGSRTGSIRFEGLRVEDVAPGNPRMSGLARRLLSSLVREIDDIADRRRARTIMWSNVLRWSGGNEAGIQSPPANVSPYMTVLECPDRAIARDLFLRWQGAGLPVTTWPDLPPEVIANPGTHSRALALRHTRFYLPVHQTLRPSSIAALGRKVLEARVGRWRVQEVTRESWNTLWARCPNANLLQAWEFGTAKELADGWRARRLAISDENDLPVAIVQVLTRRVGKFLTGARVNRGPLLVDAAASDISQRVASLAVFLREAKRRGWWFVRAAPELAKGEISNSALRALGLAALPAQAWASGRINLEASENELLMGLRGKWRTGLRKGEKLGVTVTIHDDPESQVSQLMETYSALQDRKGFEGLPEHLLRALISQEGFRWKFRLLTAHESGDDGSPGAAEPLGLLVTVRHGDTTTYLIGSTTEKGRQMQANSVLLWQAILDAKRGGSTWFDIGGLTGHTPKGVAEFKLGLNATPYELAGEWIWVAFGGASRIPGFGTRSA